MLIFRNLLLQKRHIQSRSGINDKLLRQTRSIFTWPNNGLDNGLEPFELLTNSSQENQLSARIARNRSSPISSDQRMAQSYPKLSATFIVTRHRTNEQHCYIL